MNARAVGVLLLGMAGIACHPDRPADQETESITPESFAAARAALTPEAAALLDSANAAYRTREYEEALRLYSAAAQRAPDAAAPWFGIYMAEGVLGNPGAADSAMKRARELARGATLVEPETPRDRRGEGRP